MGHSQVRLQLPEPRVLAGVYLPGSPTALPFFSSCPCSTSRGSFPDLAVLSHGRAIPQPVLASDALTWPQAHHWGKALASMASQQSIMIESDSIGTAEVTEGGATLGDHILPRKLQGLAPLGKRSRPIRLAGRGLKPATTGLMGPWTLSSHVRATPAWVQILASAPHQESTWGRSIRSLTNGTTCFVF